MMISLLLWIWGLISISEEGLESMEWRRLKRMHAERILVDIFSGRLHLRGVWDLLG